MIKKKTILLKYVIQEYLKSGEPIGSQSAKELAQMKVSSATIRNYFKSMMDEGLLLQSHASSGRIPTHFALKSYWREMFDSDKIACFENCLDLEAKSKQLDCFVGVLFLNHFKLTEVQNHENLFLVLRFADVERSEEQEVVLRYRAPLHRFAEELVGMRLEDIKSFASQVQANEFLRSLDSLLEKHFIFLGVKHIASFLQNSHGERLFFELSRGEIFNRLRNGVYFDEIFPKGYVTFVREAFVAGEKVKMLYCGKLECDYSSIL
ncbi:hypothetical protein BBW65_06820 [Helicobacter enhydrae]|uniref:HrcA family transcriptional regulator n=1 Tax=Helicobacter enhydrae TaxID=222136 RepID=A0A1B1U6V0_9HELI|nr:hypothetical protein [Helicobacter enhydrae]ANV98523.1 hypothetical protein BBW65_06820 [Helicobacter enhydrae]